MLAKSKINKYGYRALLSSYEEELSNCHIIIAKLMCILDKVQNAGHFVDYDITEDELMTKLNEYLDL
jgi:hypothetical protein